LGGIAGITTTISTTKLQLIASEEPDEPTQLSGSFSARSRAFAVALCKGTFVVELGKRSRR